MNDATTSEEWVPLVSEPTLSERARELERERHTLARKRLESMSPLQHLWAWLCDFPRPTWEVDFAEDEPRDAGFFSRAHAVKIWALDRWPENGTVERGPWMRPSEVDALPEM